MLDMRYSLIIEATEDSGFFTFYSPDLAGFTGTGSSVDDCINKAKEGMEEHVFLLKKLHMPVPKKNPTLPSLSKTPNRRKSDNSVTEISLKDSLNIVRFIGIHGTGEVLISLFIKSMMRTLCRMRIYVTETECQHFRMTLSATSSPTGLITCIGTLESLPE
jgi:predicted RNase H-like HicB family nuclease